MSFAFIHAQEILKESKIPIWEILNNIIFMHNFNYKTAPKRFLTEFPKPFHQYPTCFLHDQLYFIKFSQ